MSIYPSHFTSTHPLSDIDSIDPDTALFIMKLLLLVFSSADSIDTTASEPNPGSRQPDSIMEMDVDLIGDDYHLRPG